MAWPFLDFWRRPWTRATESDMPHIFKALSYMTICYRCNCWLDSNYLVYNCHLLYCSVLYCTVLLCDPGLLTGLDWLPTHCTVQHTVQCGTALYCTVLYSAVWHCTALYYIYSAVLHCTHTPACSHFIQCCMALYSLPRMFTCHMKNKLQYSLSRMVLHWLHIASDVQNYFMTF